jgi:hypothetical protein
MGAVVIRVVGALVLAAVMGWALDAARQPEAVRAWLDTMGICG